ncbi:MAG: hypothetical protein N4A57_17650 [Anaeromicrobium sp.]|jgi:tetratricopeptide (TPR) repeat protein|uniref:hypothetical protein n=1 Tax=Anaeromicrobium sp. TaxID=1929132 RepID=UPI0025D773BE|nr:hypothetical protein [Anaeromicrobium sp.]MCT4596076.1 hypothetical protein [Anaeromicrobium sp.]
MGKKKKLSLTLLLILCLCANGVLVYMLYNILVDSEIIAHSPSVEEQAESFISQYFDYINNKEYKKAYELFSKEYRNHVTLEDYTLAKNLESKIYSNYTLVDCDLDSKTEPYVDEEKDVLYDRILFFKIKNTCDFSLNKEIKKNEVPMDLVMEEDKFYIYPKEYNIKEEIAYYYSLLGSKELNLKNYNKSLEYTLMGLEYDSKSSSLYFVKGQAEYMLNKYFDSIESMGMAIPYLNKKENIAYAYAIVAGSYASIGDFKSGKEFIDAAMKLNPKDDFIVKTKDSIDSILNKN